MFFFVFFLNNLTPEARNHSLQDSFGPSVLLLQLTIIQRKQQQTTDVPAFAYDVHRQALVGHDLVAGSPLQTRTILLETPSEKDVKNPSKIHPATLYFLFIMAMFEKGKCFNHW